MENKAAVTICKSCGAPGKSKYCPSCGQLMAIPRITVSSLLREALHVFTHIEKGILYSLKKLLFSPGLMQKEYLAGDRIRHQKPFSMFFITATLSALIFYLVNTTLVKYRGSGDAAEAAFFRHYWVLFHICLFPFYCLITFLCFRKSGYNYGEIAVFQLYVFSFLFPVLAAIQMLKLIWPNLETRFIELPVLLIYTLITNHKFFSRLSKAHIWIMSIISITLTFLLAALVQDRLVELL